MTTPIFQRTIDGDRNGFGGYSWRQFIAASELTSHAAAFTITLQASSSQALDIAGLYVGEYSGSGYDYSSAPIQATFSGSNSASVAAGGSITSDPIVMAIGGASIVVGCYCGASGGMTRASSSPNTQIGYNGPGDYASQVSPGSMFLETWPDFIATIDPAGAPVIQEAQVSQLAGVVVTQEIPPPSGGATTSQMALVVVSKEYTVPVNLHGWRVWSIWGFPYWIEG